MASGTRIPSGGSAESGSGVTEDPEALVVAAETEAREARELAHTLEVAVRSGDDSVTLDQIEKQKALVNFLQLKVEGAQAKAETLRRAARTEALKVLRAEIDGYAADVGHKLADRLEAIATAEAEFVAAVAEHNQRYSVWRGRASALGAVHMNGRIAPPSEDEGVAFDEPTGRVHAGTRIVEIIDAPNFIERQRTLSPEDRPSLYEGLRTVASARDPLPNATFYYRASSGAVIARDHAFSPEQLQRDHLLPISREEAMN